MQRRQCQVAGLWYQPVQDGARHHAWVEALHLGDHVAEFVLVRLGKLAPEIYEAIAVLVAGRLAARLCGPEKRQPQANLGVVDEEPALAIGREV